ncbi:MAG: CoA-binding protein [Candidatus Omnitrophota bacterium]
MKNIIQDFLQQKRFAVAGSFANETKYAYQILQLLVQRGSLVYPVHPRLKEVAGLRCYPSIKDIPETCDAASLVTPAEVSEKLVRECKEKGINRVWFQPGAESEPVLEYCKKNAITAIHNFCIIVALQKEEVRNAE